MRTLPLIIDIMRDMEELCPDAWFLNFSNPESRIVLGVNKYTKIKCIGLCHGIYMARYDIAHMLGREPSEIDVFGAGMNHFQWILDIRDIATGEDLYPMFREKEAHYDAAFRPYSRKIFKYFGLWPTCSDDHLGEYQSYGYEAGEEGYNFEDDARGRIRAKQEIEEIIEGKKDISGWLRPSGEHAIDAVVSIFFNERRQLPAAIVYNGGAIPQLPPDVAVEIPVIVDGSGVHKTVIDNLPEGVIGMLNTQVSPQRLSVHAAYNGSKELALQALLCEPTINSTAAAEMINNELFELNRKYIKKCR
jgi:alpha-galactosidase